MIDYYRNNPALLDSLRAPIYEDKVVDFIVELAKVTDRAVTPAELIAAEPRPDEDETTAQDQMNPGAADGRKDRRAHGPVSSST